jgi:hypothetical protein
VTVQATAAAGATTQRKLQIAVLTPPPLIVTSSFSNATKDVFYSANVEIVDGIPPFSWSVSMGSLPNGLTINAGTGVISGTPTATGTSTFTVSVVSDLVASNSASKQLSITVN